MASFFTAVLLMCFVYMVLGAGVYTQYDIQKTPRYIRTGRRDVNVVKRSSSVPTFENETVGRDLQNNGNLAFLGAIERHEGVFLDLPTDSTYTFQEMMEIIYKTRTSKWKGQREVIVADLPCDKRNLGHSDNVNDFYGNIIKKYTAEDRCVYREVNEALRAQSNSSIGSFALLLNVVLTQWTSLSSYSSTTYRGVGDSFNIEPYTAGTIFTWTAFTSSSTDMDVACVFAKQGGGLFIIDNSAVSEWRPRGIEIYSLLEFEREYLYPATAMFKVTLVEDGACGERYLKTIHISLQTGDTGEISRASTIGWTLKRTITLVIVAAIVGIFE